MNTEELYQWLGQVDEETLEPELPICDPHHHLWDYPQSRYLLHEVLHDLNTGHNIRSTVFLECGSMFRADGPEEMKPVGETEFVQGIAAMSASGQYGETRVAAGIVGFADLRRGKDVAPVLEAHLKASPDRFRGIRHSCSWHADKRIKRSHSGAPEGLLLDPGYQEGCAMLKKYDLTFDIWLYHTQLGELAQLVRKCPDITVILNHIGGPLGVGPFQNKRKEVFNDWKQSINSLAAFPNVVVKLGGLAMPVNGFGWHTHERPPSSRELFEAQSPYYRHCIEKFGVRRCMFESNFPMDRLSCSYNILWNSFKRLTRDFSASEKAALYHDNAVRVYRL